MNWYYERRSSFPLQENDCSMFFGGVRSLLLASDFGPAREAKISD
jgi:hypothetical protein